MARYTPISSVFSSSPSCPPSYHRRSRSMRSTRRGRSGRNGNRSVSSTPSSTLSLEEARGTAAVENGRSGMGGLVYSPTRFEVILPPSPSPPHNHRNQSTPDLSMTPLTSSSYEQIPRARVQNALTSLRAAFDQAQERLSLVVSIHAHQSGFSTTQKKLLSRLEKQLEEVEREHECAKDELDSVEKEIQDVQKALQVMRTITKRKSDICTRSSKRGWTNTFQRTLHSMRTKAI